MTVKCEAFKGSREPDCTNDAEYIFYDHKNQAGYPISVCKEHLDAALEECYDVIKEVHKP